MSLLYYTSGINSTLANAVSLGGMAEHMAADEITPVGRRITRRGMPERSWDRFVTEQDRQVYQLGGFGRPGSAAGRGRGEQADPCPQHEVSGGKRCLDLLGIRRQEPEAVLFARR